MSWLFIKRPRFFAVVVWLTGLYCVLKWVNDLFCVTLTYLNGDCWEERKKKWVIRCPWLKNLNTSRWCRFVNWTPEKTFLSYYRHRLPFNRYRCRFFPVIRTQLSDNFQTVNIGLVFSVLRMGKRLTKLALIGKQNERMKQKCIPISFVSFCQFIFFPSIERSFIFFSFIRSLARSLSPTLDFMNCE